MMWPKEKPIIDIVGGWVLYPLPHQTKFIDALSQNKARQFKFRRQMRERMMNFKEAVQAAQEGAKVRRPHWNEDMWMTWYTSNDTEYLIHSHPYWPTQTRANSEGYIYVTENDDATASDWEKIYT